MADSTCDMSLAMRVSNVNDGSLCFNSTWGWVEADRAESLV